MDIVISVVAKIAEYLVEPVKRRIDYLRSYESNIEDFRNQVKSLEEIRAGVQQKVDVAQRNGELILPNVDKWLRNVKEITDEAMEFSDEKLQKNERCFNGYCPNLKSRYQQSKKAEKNKLFADKLEQGGNFNTVSLPAPPPPIGTTSNEDAEVFSSRKSAFNDIMKAVKDVQINMIGIYGMGGVGKTTLVKEVGKRAKDDNLCDEVVMAVVSQSPDFRKIQGEIADMLGLKFKEESVSGRAARLCERLKQKKRVLVILDDIWEPVKLEDIGIPFGEKNGGCKIVLTSRKRDACKQMGTQKYVSVAVLHEQEAWNLFRKMAGKSVDSPDLYPVAYKVAKGCAGLPIAIVTVARALKDKNLSAWNVAANRLHKLIPISDKVFSTLELSYDYLQSEEVKSFFLFCCIFGEDHNIAIEDLWKHGMGLGLFKGTGTVEEARESAYTLADTLKDSCLLQEGNDKDSVKMHDVVRDFAISVAARDEHGFLVRSGPEWNEFPESNEFKRYSTISLISDAIQKLPTDRLECPKVEFLYLGFSHPMLKLPENFFSGMKKLKVLVMSRMHFSSLPSSLVDLENLQILCLDGCNLENVSILGKLKDLRVLSITDSDNLMELPKEIGDLTHLRLLDLSRCSYLKVIRRDVFVRLSQLEGLYMADSSRRHGFREWETYKKDQERRNVSLGDLKYLSRLTSLKICVPDTSCLPDDDLLFKNLLRFQISLGTAYASADHFLYSRALTLRSLRIPENLLRTPFKTAEYLHVEKIEKILSLKCLVVRGCEDMNYIFPQKELFSLTTYSNLKKLHLEDLPNLKGIYSDKLPREFFRELQELKLKNLPALVDIWKDPAPDVCFGNLRVVEVTECNGLKILFSHSIVQDLSMTLVELSVIDCKIMEEIFRNEAAEAALPVDIIAFSVMQNLLLEGLPNLKSFCSKLTCMDTNTNEPLFNEKVVFPALEKLEICSVDNVQKIWHQQTPANSFSQLKVLKVKCCHQLQNVGPFYMLSRLHNLEILDVEDCNSMEDVVIEEGLAIKEGLVNGIQIFQLRELRLSVLPKLKHIWWDKYPHGTLGFQNLISLNIQMCNSLKSLFSPSVVSRLVLLREIEIDSCEMIETMVKREREVGQENPVGSIVFPLLHTLTLKNLPNLLSYSHISGLAKEGDNLHDLEPPLFDEKLEFPSLEKLLIRGVNALKEIWHPQLPPKFFFPLKEIEVGNCPKLKSLFLPSIASGLVQLQELKIKSCQMMETIIANEKEETCIEKFVVFPQLHTFELQDLPNFMSFNSGSYTLNCPSLKILRIEEFPAKEGNLDCDRIPLFDKKVIFPVLERLVINDVHNMKEFWHLQIPGKSFSQLKVLEVFGCPQLLKVAPFNLLQCLEEISVKRCDLVEVIELQGVVVEEGDINSTGMLLHNLRKLKLYNLPKLKGIMVWDKHPYGTFLLHNLTSIDIYECNNLKSLLPPSTARNLVKLQEVEIDSCKLMETIISKEREGEESFLGNVMFPQIQSLKLLKLPNLVSFHATELNWSSLKTLWVRSCSTMKTFTCSMPHLQKLNTNHDIRKEAIEKGNLCISQHPFFDNKVAFTNLEWLMIEDMENIEEIFDNQLPDEYFCQLKNLTVEQCHKLSRLVPSNILPRLEHLERLSIIKCNSIELIFEGIVGEGQATIPLSQLKALYLCDLPSLKVFCSGNYALVCPSLYSVQLTRCPKIQTFSSSISTPKLKEVVVEDRSLWEGDLNTTIQHLFHKKNSSAIEGVDDGEPSHKPVDSGISTITGLTREDDISGVTPNQGQDVNANQDEQPCKLERISSEEKANDGQGQDVNANQDEPPHQLGRILSEEKENDDATISSEEKAKDIVTAEESVKPSSDFREENLQIPKMSVFKDSAFENVVPDTALGDQKMYQSVDSGQDMLGTVGDISNKLPHSLALKEGLIYSEENPRASELGGSMHVVPRGVEGWRVDPTQDIGGVGEDKPLGRSVTGPDKISVVEIRKAKDSCQSFVPLTKADANTQNDLSNDALMDKNQLGPNEMVISRAEFESLQRDLDLLMQKSHKLEKVGRHRRRRAPNTARHSDVMGLSMTLDVGWAAFVFGLLLLFLTFFACWTLVLKMNTQYVPTNDALMDKIQLRHNEMVVSRAEFESLQRERQRAQILEDLLVTGYRPPGV